MTDEVDPKLSAAASSGEKVAFSSSPSEPSFVPEEHGLGMDSAAAKGVKTQDDDDDDDDDADEDDDDMAALAHADIPFREWSFDLPILGGRVVFNPFTSLVGLGVLWGFAIWCMADPTTASAKLTAWKTNVTMYFTWLFIGANPAFTFFVLFLAVRYGKVKLGRRDTEPEFSDATYFAMIFSAGVGVGLFFYGVAEPLWHQGSHWFANAGYRTQDDIDQFALVLSCYHWGFAGWSPYLIVAIAAGLIEYRFGIHMTFRSCLYPLLGSYTWGWIGDVIDGFAIVTTVSGICTSLGLGAMQIQAGLQRLGWVGDDPTERELVRTNVAIIWIITAIATASVISGLHVGIKLLSVAGFSLGMLILFLVLVWDKTYYIFNLFVQTVGYYCQWAIFQIPFWTDAFGQLKPGEGRAVDGLAAESWWMDAWTVFYMAWWTAWAGFVGLFIARISKGRTIREVVMYCFIAPMLYSFLWFVVLGGVGLRQARQALELIQLGNETFGDPEYFHAYATCYDVPQEDVVDSGGTTVFTNSLPGVTPVCTFDSSTSTQAWFNVMYSFSFPIAGRSFDGFGPFMSGLSLVAIALYFITSSDSGSFVVDKLASNGHEDHHWVQRLFWALTEGGVATGLMVAGGNDALSALQTASVVFGLPFTVFLFYMCQSILHMCIFAEEDNKNEVEGTYPDPDDRTFHMPVYGGIFNVLEWAISMGEFLVTCGRVRGVHEDRVRRGMDRPTKFQVIEFLRGLVLPFWSLHIVCSNLDRDRKGGGGRGCRLFATVSYAALHFTWVGLFSASGENFGFVALGWGAFFVNACTLTQVRTEVRTRFDIKGSVIEDFLASSFFYPQALTQMLVQFDVGMPPEEKEFEA